MADGADWPVRIGQAMAELRHASMATQDLFPDCAIKIEIELRVDNATTVRFLVEGPVAETEALLAGPLNLPFEYVRPPESLRTAASPTEGTAADQAELTAGTTVEGTAKAFNLDCLKRVSKYQNNCAHYLSDALIEAGFSELAQPHDCISSGGRCASPDCTSGGKRPIRAKDVRCWFETKDSTPVPSVTPNTGFYAVYQERQSDGQGHVVILDSNAWKYYGTAWFEAGLTAPNDWRHWYYQW